MWLISDTFVVYVTLKIALENFVPPGVLGADPKSLMLHLRTQDYFLQSPLPLTKIFR